MGPEMHVQRQLVAMDPQRLGTPTAAYDLHFQEQFLQQKHELSSRGFLTVQYLGKREQLPVSTKGSQISPRFAEVVIKQLDPRWARKGVTTALLKAAGYGADVAVKTEFAGDLPAHLSCWSTHLARSDVTVAKVAAPASDPSLRRLPRTIQFQGLSISISVSRSLQNKHEQRKAREADTSSKQARRKATKVKRQTNKQQSGQQQAAPPQSAKLAGSQPTVFFFFFFGRERYSLHKCNDNNLKEMFFFFFFFGRERYSLHECNDSNLKSM